MRHWMLPFKTCPLLKQRRWVRWLCLARSTAMWFVL
ncbi:hypothetical protein EVA_07385 [gut metagenome]|uniref:Uncharacterized protein n=1 Tax=gut metagenome TaxID=749906 RepID=J9GCB9_9ZZZZ